MLTSIDVYFISVTAFWIFTGLHFHVIGEGVVRVRTPRQERVYDRENYIDFRMRLLGEPGLKKDLF